MEPERLTDDADDPAFCGEVPEPSPHARPVCARCFQPVEGTNDYCEHCGRAVGRYTEYLPFVNIRWQLAGYEKLFERLWPRRTSGWSTVLGTVVALLLAPFLLLALPFVRRRDKPVEPAEKASDASADETSAGDSQAPSGDPP